MARGSRTPDWSCERNTVYYAGNLQPDANGNGRSLQSQRKVLVTMGGSDPENVTARVTKALQFANPEATEAKIVVGGSNPHFTELQVMASHFDFPLQLHRDASNIAELMFWSDVAVSAAGSTCWELIFLRAPALLLDLAENQPLPAQQLHKQNCAIHVGNTHVLPEELAHALKSLAGSKELRETRSLRSRRLVDGEGARRVASVLLGKTHLTLRSVTPDDAGATVAMGERSAGSKCIILLGTDFVGNSRRLVQ
jgi:UDP-2,4-diacetamido-2,4,6-trideoxy-beta-L-altropyranose hydrolase